MEYQKLWICLRHINGPRERRGYEVVGAADGRVEGAGMAGCTDVSMWQATVRGSVKAARGRRGGGQAGRGREVGWQTVEVPVARSQGAGIDGQAIKQGAVLRRFGDWKRGAGMGLLVSGVSLICGAPQIGFVPLTCGPSSAPHVSNLWRTRRCATRSLPMRQR